MIPLLLGTVNRLPRKHQLFFQVRGLPRSRLQRREGRSDRVRDRGHPVHLLPRRDPRIRERDRLDQGGGGGAQGAAG